MANKSFSDLITFARGTGATRVNSSGLLVGVDFSITSNTIATGSKTFTLTADANVNRDWAVGANVIVVAQAGATGSMTGDVTSYTPSTQALVINVTSVTGSGTSTDWRIGSLDVREDYDPVTLVKKGVLSEAGVTNTFLYSDNISNGYWTKNPRVTASIGTENNRTGSKAYKLALNTDIINLDAYIIRPFTLVSGETHTYSAIIKSDGSVRWIQFYVQPNNGGGYVFFDVIDGLVGNTSNLISNASITPTTNGFFKIIFSCTANLSSNNDFRISLSSVNGAGGFATFTGSVGNGIHIGELQRELGNFTTSYIPTTTISATRNADSFALTATALTSIRQGEGTLYAEVDCPDTGVAQKRALRLTGTNADIRIGKDGTGTLSNFTKMTEGAGVRLMGTGTLLLSCDGRESLNVNAINDRTGVLTTITSTNAVAFNGTNQFVLACNTFASTLASEEATIDSALTTLSGKGAGAISISGVHYNGNRFLMSANNSAGVVFISTDGLSYRRINTPVITQPTNEVTSGMVGGTLRNVIVGNTGFIATSDDNGETWTARTSGTTTSFTAVAFGGGTFVALNGTAANTKYSTDGITWTSSTGLTGLTSDIVYTGSQFVAINTVGGVFTSTNGITFNAVTTTGITPTFTSAQGITYNNGFYVIVGNSGQIAVSQTGAAASPTTWATFVTAQTGTASQLNEVLVFGGNFYAVGATQTILRFNQSLTPTFSLPNAGITATISGVAASTTTLLLCGTNGGISSSTDGTTFTSRTNNTSVLNGIAFGNNTFVSVGNTANGSGYIATIGADGTVTRRVSGVPNPLLNVRFLGGVFYAVHASGNGGVAYSSDGVTYTNSGITNVGTGLFDIAFGGGVYVAVGGGGRYVTNTNGTTFTTAVQTGATTQQLNGIDFANGLFVAVGNAGAIITSPNGTTWTLRTSGTTFILNSVMYSTRDQLWYAAGSLGTLLYSPDAITWTAVQNSGTASVFTTSLQASQQLPVFKSGANKLAISYKSNQVISALNGAVSSTDITASIPDITSGNIGENLNGYIKKVDIFKTALTAAEISAKTL